MTSATDTRPDVAEIDEALRHADTSVKRLRLVGTHEQIADAERYRDQLLEQRS